MSWFPGYGGQPTTSADAANISFLEGLPSGYVQQGGYSGSSATEVYEKFAKDCADEGKKAAFAKEIAKQFGR